MARADVRIVIADSQPLFAAAVGRALAKWTRRGCMHVALGYGSLEETCLAHPVELVLLDVALPGAPALAPLLALRHMRPDAVVLVSTNEAGPGVIEPAWALGAAGVVERNCLPKQLNQVVGRVLEGQRCFPAGAGSGEPAFSDVAKRLSQLTPVQTRVLFCLGEGLCNKRVAQRFGISQSTAKQHVMDVLRKLRVPSRLNAGLLVRSLAPLLSARDLHAADAPQALPRDGGLRHSRALDQGRTLPAACSA